MATSERSDALADHVALLQHELDRRLARIDELERENAELRRALVYLYLGSLKENER